MLDVTTVLTSSPPVTSKTGGSIGHSGAALTPGRQRTFRHRPDLADERLKV